MARMGEREIRREICWVSLKQQDLLEDLGIDGRIILECC